MVKYKMFKKNILLLAISIVAIPLVNLTFTRCSRDNADFRRRCEDAEWQVYQAYLDVDYNRILALTDSVKRLGLLSEGKADYWMGYAYDRLLGNALKFSSQGSVMIKANIENGQLMIAVEDTGIGIPREQQERVFEQFYKVDSFVPGIGLGLTVARRSAQLLGGTLTIDPTYTKGYRFVVTLDAR